MNLQTISRYLRERQKYLELKKQYDVVLEPIPPVPSLRSAASGNWANDFLKTTKLADKLPEHLQRKVVVIVHDTAGKLEHKFLQQAAWNELGFNTTKSSSVEDVHGHGTHCAGIYAAIDPGQPLGVAQTLVENGYLRVVPGKCLNDNGAASWSEIQQSVQRGLEIGEGLQNKGYFVLHSMSLGGGGYSEDIANLIKQGVADNQLFVVAAGNTYREGLQFPAKIPEVMAWGSHDEFGKRSSFSTWGDGLFAAAPGQNILSTLPGDKLASWSGTSMATPAGGAILCILASIYPDLKSNQDFKDFIREFATDLMDKGYDTYTGIGSPVLTPYLGQDPEPDEPEQPDQPSQPAPDPEPKPEPTKPVRDIYPTLDQVAFRVYRENFENPPVVLRGSILLKHKTGRWVDHAIPEIQKIAHSWLARTSLMISAKHDLEDAAKYLAWFVEYHFQRQHNLEVFVEQIQVDDLDGLTFGYWPNSHYRSRFANALNEGVQLIEDR